MELKTQKSLALLPSKWPGPEGELDVPYVPTPPELVDQMIEIAAVTSTDIVYDLGCGDGRIVIAAALKKRATGVGVDIDPRRLAEACRNAAAAGILSLVTFKKGDLYETDVRGASVLAMYLLSSVNLELRARLLEQLEPGSRIVSHDFSMDSWTADRVKRWGDHTIFLWHVPANVSGVWHWNLPRSLGGESYTFIISQHFQKIAIDVRGPRPSVRSITSGLQGRHFETVVREYGPSRRMVLTGNAQGDSIQGSLIIEGLPRMRWRAERERSSMTAICT